MSLIQRLFAALLLTAATYACAAPQEVRIAVVSYTAAGKRNFAGSVGIINREGELERELAKRGVKLTWVPVSTAAVGPQINEAFSNRSIDFAAYGDLPSVIVNAAKVPTKLLVPSASSNTYLVVPAKSTVTSIKDLKGKRVALMRGRPWEYPFVKLLQANGMQLSDVRVVNLNPQAGAAAVSAGSVDAFFTLSDAWLLVDKGLAKIVWDSKAAPRSWQMRAELWGDQAFVQANPELAQLVVDAFVKNARWSSDPTNKEEVIRLGANAGLPESAIRRDYDATANDWKERSSPLFTPALADHYRDLAAYAKQSRLIPAEVDIVSTFEPRFVQSALQRFKLEGYWTGATK
ncbi:ABC transporter substrate-binding protein [Duganella sp. FT135W]|uniref:ABC transporter substrate-binding protein n=1 Tax=Duganella flavida TaxID=2692175 RepID=A0A6L8KE31_9BURK|nr:ABC transporter substrate-binding protein [Duganella flavida]MYM22711.1 ABC transporter substrate-binding protein [Duganella flavida]